MPQTCAGVSRADSGVAGTSDAERVIAIFTLILRSGPRAAASIAIRSTSTPLAGRGRIALAIRVRGVSTSCACGGSPSPQPSPRKRGEGEASSARDFLDAGDQFVDGFIDRHFLAHHAVHRLGPDVLVVQDGELVVLGKVERLRASGELVIDRLAMAVGLPERALLACSRHREPAAERALDIGP